ncbi:MAG: hypothetical protein HY275_16995 [Gemmatimonadetes bacterium]|nr:hypothetical protein [Gemmatimonadota bacterium]
MPHARSNRDIADDVGRVRARMQRRRPVPVMPEREHPRDLPGYFRRGPSHASLAQRAPYLAGTLAFALAAVVVGVGMTWADASTLATSVICGGVVALGVLVAVMHAVG